MPFTWDDYVSNMVAQGAMDAGIYTLNGGAVCAQTPNFSVSSQEVEMMKNCCQGTDTKLQVNGHSCIMLGRDEEFVRGKTLHDVNDQKLFYYCALSSMFVVVVRMTGAGERKAASIATNIAQHLRAAQQ